MKKWRMDVTFCVPLTCSAIIAREFRAGGNAHVLGGPALAGIRRPPGPASRVTPPSVDE
jgi:hypothetical protein